MQMLQSKSVPVSWWKNTFAASKNTGYANSRANGRGSLEANTILRDIVNSPNRSMHTRLQRKLTAPILQEPTLKHIDVTVNRFQFFKKKMLTAVQLQLVRKKEN